MSGHIKTRETTSGPSYQARIPNPTNHRQDIVKTFRYKKDAELWLANTATEINRGDFILTPNKPFKEVVEVWERTRLNSLAPKTRERYTGILNNYLLPAFGSMPLDRLRRPVIKEWFAKLAQEHSAAQARKVQIVLSSILSEAVEMDLLRENPAARLRLVAAPAKAMTVLTWAEVRALAEAMPTPSDALAVWVAAETGVRAGELWALQRKHVTSDGQLRVERTLTSISGKLSFRDTTKTGNSRTISLSQFLIHRLDEHLADLADDDLVFTAHEGGSMSHNNFMRRIFRPAVLAALPPNKHGFRWHDLRHTSASLLIADGANILLVSKRLGHSKPSMTLDVYGHLYKDDEAALATAFDRRHAAVVPIEKALAS